MERATLSRLRVDEISDDISHASMLLTEFKTFEAKLALLKLIRILKQERVNIRENR